MPADWAKLARKELVSLAQIWTEQAQQLYDSDAVKRFNERLSREWAIETGIIEHLYTIDRGITQLLIEKGIEASFIPYGYSDKPAELVVAIIEDQKEALEGLFDFIAKRRALSTSYIKELHQAFTRHQEITEALDTLGRRVSIPLIKGDWKKNPNNPKRPHGEIHEYCPPEHVASEMDRLIEMHIQHHDMCVPPEIEAAWLHHRFTQIHPFQDGNGRVARTLASLIFIRARWFPLVVNRDNGDAYIGALEQADAGELSQLVNLFSELQKNAFVRALSNSEFVLKQQEPIEQIISSAVKKIRERKYVQIRLMAEEASLLAKKLESLVEKRFNSIADSLRKELQSMDRNYWVSSDRSNEENDSWFRRQIILIAKQLNYFADTRTYRSWVRLKVKEERQTEIVLSFHSLGVEFLGVMAVSSFLEHRERNEDGEVNVDGPYILSNELFQFAHNELEDDVTSRFQEWLERVAVVGLEQWRKQL